MLHGLAGERLCSHRFQLNSELARPSSAAYDLAFSSHAVIGGFSVNANLAMMMTFTKTLTISRGRKVVAKFGTVHRDIGKSHSAVIPIRLTPLTPKPTDQTCWIERFELG